MKLLAAVVVVLFSHQGVQAKVQLHKIENCDTSADYPIKFNLKLKDGAGMQIVEEGSVSSKVALGNNIIDEAEVFVKENGKFEHLITIKESLCDAVNKFMGEFMHDMQEAAGLSRGSCPIPAGDYKIKDHPLDFEKFKFKRIPEGEFKVTVTLKDTTTSEVLNCHNIEFDITKDA